MTDDNSIVKELSDAIIKNVNRGVLERIAENPTTPLLNLGDLTPANIEEYFFSLHSTVWGMWSIYDGISLEKAVKFFQNEVTAFYRFLVETGHTVDGPKTRV